MSAQASKGKVHVPVYICSAQSENLSNLEIAHYSCMISRYTHVLRNLTQSRNSENAHRNLEIAQILRLRGTYS